MLPYFYNYLSVSSKYFKKAIGKILNLSSSPSINHLDNILNQKQSMIVMIGAIYLIRFRVHRLDTNKTNAHHGKIARFTQNLILMYYVISMVFNLSILYCRINREKIKKLLKI